MFLLFTETKEKGYFGFGFYSYVLLESYFFNNECFESLVINFVQSYFKDSVVKHGFIPSILEQSCWSKNNSFLGSCCQLGIRCRSMLYNHSLISIFKQIRLCHSLISSLRTYRRQCFYVIGPGRHE